MGLDASPAHGDGAERVISETCLYASPCRPDNTIFEEFDYTPTYPPDWDARKRAVKERDGYRCKILGCVITTDLEVHHRVPIRQRSDHRLKNLACLCQYHHYFVDREHEVVGERIDNDRYSAVQSFWRTNRRAGGSHRVERHVQRYIRASFSDLSEIKTIFGLRCSCGGEDFAAKIYPDTNHIRVTCGDCKAAWMLEHGLKEEVGPQLTTIFHVTRNGGGIVKSSTEWNIAPPIRVFLCADCILRGLRIELRRKLGVYGYFWGCPNWGGNRKHFKRVYRSEDKEAARIVELLNSR